MPQKKATVITAVGAGGKTTYLEKRAADYVRRGMRAVITTTTHIWKPETAAASTGDAFERYVFHTESGIDYAGTPEESGKLSAPPAEVLDWIIASYDAVLVEGDGSHCMPVKIPGPGEPVIPDETDEIAVIMGRQAVGRKLSVVCHRYDENRLPDGIVTDDMLETIARDFYIAPLQERYPGTDVFYAPSEYRPEMWELPGSVADLAVTAVLLASGFGRRYGGNKLEEDFGGKPLYRRTLDHVAQALGRDRTIVVTQYQSILDEMEREGISAVRNDFAADGISASIRIGTQEALKREDTEAVIFFAADMPYLPADEIRRYARQFLWSEKTFGCMVAGPQHVMTNPGAFRLYESPALNIEERTGQHGSGQHEPGHGKINAAAGQLLALSGDHGAMRIMKQFPQEIYRYQVAEESVRDIDVRTGPQF